MCKTCYIDLRNATVDENLLIIDYYACKTIEVILYINKKKPKCA